MRTHVRHQTSENMGQDVHMFQICAYQLRVTGNHLANEENRLPIQVFNFSDILPSECDIENLRTNFAILVARVWLKYIEKFKTLAAPKPVKHQHIAETRVKTKRVCSINQYVKNSVHTCQLILLYTLGQCWCFEKK